MDSDIIAHFLQVHKQLVESRWNHSEIAFTHQGGKVIKSSFSGFEDFVFAIVYLRQFLLKKDKLLEDVVERYRRHCSCKRRCSWVTEEQKSFEAVLERDAIFLEGYKVRDVLDAFMYGAALIHKPPHLKAKQRAHFLALYDGKCREELLFALNESMKSLLRHVHNVALVVHRDFAYWLQEYDLPRPDVRWHSDLFDTKTDI